jgi:glucose/arabinose dehydrogenase
MTVHLLAVLALVGCDFELEVVPPTEPPVSGLVLTRVASGLGSLTALASPPGDPRIFLVEQVGWIRIEQDGSLLSEPFLDLRELTREQGERGLLGLAFHPEYAANGRFFVNYTDLSGDTRVAEYRVSMDPSRAEPSSSALLLTIPQPFGNHNGGDLAFGPDGMLYIATGDGGSANDPMGNGQNTGTLLGKLLRMNVSVPGVASVPADNPFAGNPTAGRGEIWSWGLRNPWRISFDFEDGLLYIADVGQNRWEEIDVVPAASAGLNFGWADMEGEECRTTGCAGRGLVLPALVYSHSDGCSVTGGAVYRGGAIPGLQGHYFYSDLCGRFVRSFRYEEGAAGDHRSWDLRAPDRVNSMGRDAAGEMYLLTAAGDVYRIDPEEGG